MIQSNFNIAAIQSNSVAGDIDRNVTNHVRLTRLAAEEGAKVAIFPELSLTGYEPTLASDIAIDADNEILKPLQQVADKLDITILAGCPIRSQESRPYIGVFIFKPDEEIATYRKRFVHSGEEPYFISCPDVVVCQSHGKTIGPAICADISNEQHPLDVSGQGADVYAAGVAMTPNGVAEAENRMSEYARRYRFLTIMANYASDTGGYTMSGRSAAWDESGTLLAQAASHGESLVLAESTVNGWNGRVIDLS